MSRDVNSTLFLTLAVTATISCADDQVVDDIFRSDPPQVCFEDSHRRWTICCDTGSNYIEGTNSADLLTGSSANECIIGLDGDDTIDASTGDDLVFAGAGDDELDGGPGDDELHGGADRDLIRGRDGEDRIYGDDGHDELRGNAGNDELRGGLGGDLLIPGPGADQVYGEAGDDVIELYDPCEVSAGSVIDGGLGDDTLYVPLPLTDPAMTGLSVISIENVIVYDDEELWATGAECLSTTPTGWTYDAGTGLRHRWATAEERIRNRWLSGTRLIELSTSDIAHGSTAAVLRTPSVAGLITTTLSFDQSFTGLNFHGLHYTSGAPTSFVPVFERYVAHAGPSASSWGTAFLDDYGGVSGWVYDGTNQWSFMGSETNAFIEPAEPAPEDPSDIADYIVLQPAPMMEELDVTPPNLGQPYSGYLVGEGKWCTDYADNWMVKLFENAQIINSVLRSPVGPGARFDLQVAYCHIFNSVIIDDPNFPGGSKYFAPTKVAGWCDSHPSFKSDFDGWLSPDEAPSSQDADYWGLHLLDCVDDDDHAYPFDCGKYGYCYRDRVWTQAAHAQLHITVPDSKLAQVVHGGRMAGPTGTPKPPYAIPGTPAVRGISTLPEGTAVCTGLPAAGDDGCPGPGASVSATPSSPWMLTPGHEVSHNLGARDSDWIFVNPPPPNCDNLRTIMGTGPTQSNDCVALQFSPTTMTKMLDCVADPTCPRSDYGN